MRTAKCLVFLFVLATCWLLCLAARSQVAVPVTVTLSFEDHRHLYKIGEPILLHLTFVASEPGLSLNATTTEPASPIDTVTLSPTVGVFPWLDDQARGQRYSPDYAALAPLQVGKPETVILPLNAVYRFDAPGHYRVQVTTGRVLRGGVDNSERFGPLASNTLSFDIEAMSEAEEANRAAVLEQEIRQAADLRTAQQYAEELDCLTGDASTRMKLSLFLHPKTFYPVGVDVSRGLWIARNRSLVVAKLEQALRDPTQELSAGSSLLALTVSLKTRLESPFNPASPAAPLATKPLEWEYLEVIAASLPERKGKALVDAARTAFIQLAQRKDTAQPAFAAAREILITHFAEVNEFNVDWLLNGFGEYLQDRRIVPALKQILHEQHNPIMNVEHTAVLKQLMKIAPAESRNELVGEVCDNNPTLLQALSDAPLQTLPETDGCLLRKVHAAANPAKELNLQWASEFAARFASSAIYDDLLALYRESGGTWDKQAQGYILGYFMRWDSKRGLPLLESALPTNAPQLDFGVLFALNRVYSPSLETFWLKRIANAPPEQAGQAASCLSQNGPAEDQASIRARLESWRAKWKGQVIPEPEARLEVDLMWALVSGKNWHMPDVEVAKLREACLSSACKSGFPSKR